ncbi:MAG: hypothetical protein J1E35_04805 [Lachnospiraceae bacterium]|nr:hypothetical protein [Lachnospiraceae bacterium]
MEKKMGGEIKKFLLMLVLVVLLAGLAVFYLYLPLVRQRDAMIEENVNLNGRSITLQNMVRDKEIFKEGINASRTKMGEAFNRYGVGNTPEKSIMLVKRMETEVGVKMPSVSFSSPSLFTSIQVPVIEDIEGTEGDNYNVTYASIDILTETLTVSYSCNYEQLKKLIDFINVYPERMNIESISISYDSETSDLSGSLVLNLFAVTGTDRVYEEPKIDDIRLGEDNIFAQ